MNGIGFNYLECGREMLNNKNENVTGGYMKKTYNELIEDISPDEIDELYCYLEELKEKYMSKDA